MVTGSKNLVGSNRSCSKDQLFKKSSINFHLIREIHQIINPAFSKKLDTIVLHAVCV